MLCIPALEQGFELSLVLELPEHWASELDEVLALIGVPGWLGGGKQTRKLCSSSQDREAGASGHTQQIWDGLSVDKHLTGDLKDERRWSGQESPGRRNSICKGPEAGKNQLAEGCTETYGWSVVGACVGRTAREEVWEEGRARPPQGEEWAPFQAAGSYGRI